MVSVAAQRTEEHGFDTRLKADSIHKMLDDAKSSLKRCKTVLTLHRRSLLGIMSTTHMSTASWSLSVRLLLGIATRGEYKQGNGYREYK